MLSGLQKSFVVAVVTMIFAGQTAIAKDAQLASEVLALAEQAMTDGDYKAGVQRYVDAALASESIETARQATLVATDFGFPASAATASDRWLALNGASVEARQFRAYAALRTSDVKDATDRMFDIFDTTDDAEAICEHAQDALSRDARAEDVRKLFSGLAKQLDETPCVIRLAASTEVGASEYKAAESHLARLKKIGAFDNPAKLVALRMLIRNEKADEAFTDESLFFDPDATIEQRLELAFLNAQADQKENALNMVSLLAQEFPDNSDVMQAEGLLQLQTGDLDAARATFLRLLTSGDKTQEALFYLGRFAEGNRRFEQAQRMYSQVESGDLVVAAQQRASTLISQRDGIEAGIAHLDGFIKRHPRYGLNMSAVLASAYTEGEYFDQALALYDEYLEVRPDAEFAMLARADVLLQSGELDDAIDAFRAVVKRFPDSANALNALGYTLADRTTKLREAERLIDKAMDKEPDNAAIIDSKGWVLFRRGRFEEAREFLERAWKEFPDPEVAAHLGETLWRLGKEEESRELLQEAWQRFPNDDNLRKTIERLLEDGPTTRS